MKNTTITAPAGFRAAAVRAGIKASGAFDVGLLVADRPCAAAAAFTTNKVVGPAVDIDREHIRSGRAQAIFINSGNANTCTGPRGRRDAVAICHQLAQQVHIAPEDVLLCSTGIIGHFLPMDKIRHGIDMAAALLSNSARAGRNLTRAIMTTDTRPKSAYRQIRLGRRVVQLAGIVKGSGMIAPNMATMLAFMTTDVAISPALLRRALREVVDQTFNKVTIDNHTSTSDTAVVLASGLADNPRITRANVDYQHFVAALGGVCDDLARQIAADGEGATCFVTVRLTGAANAQEARAALRAIVDSPLVRTAFNGADPNWGRIVSAVGYSGARFDLARLSCKIAGTMVFRGGRPCRFDPARLSRKMKAKAWQVDVDLAFGRFNDFCYTCDLSHEYITINADYHT